MWQFLCRKHVPWLHTLFLDIFEQVCKGTAVDMPAQGNTPPSSRCCDVTARDRMAFMGSMNHCDIVGVTHSTQHRVDSVQRLQTWSPELLAGPQHKWPNHAHCKHRHPVQIQTPTSCMQLPAVAAYARRINKGTDLGVGDTICWDSVDITKTCNRGGQHSTHISSTCNTVGNDKSGVSSLVWVLKLQCSRHSCATNRLKGLWTFAEA